MDRSVAELLMKDMLAMSEPLNSITILCERIGDTEERKTFRRGVGQLMDKLYADLMLPIIRQYPDLDPDN